MRTIDAVIFDADGTLLDTREFIFSAFQHPLGKSGYPIPDRSILSEVVGKSLADCYRMLAPPGDNAALCEMHHAYQENNLELVDSYEGLVLTLDTLREHEIKIGILSSRGSNLVKTLERVGIKDHCDVILNADDVAKLKPDPEGVFRILKILNVGPERTLMVGDSVHDIKAGKNASLAFTIGITHGFGKKKALESAGADHIVDRIPDIIPLLLKEQAV